MERYIPLVHDDEKTADNSTGNRIGIELAYSRDKHSPGDTTEEAIHIGVDSFPCKNVRNKRLSSSERRTLCPKLDASQCVTEDFDIGDQPENLIGDPRTCDYW